jgi:hypothetical protein
VPAVVKSHIERPPAIHVLLELSCDPHRIASETKKNEMKERTDGRLCLSDLCKLHHASALGSCAVKQDLRKLDLTRGLE